MAESRRARLEKILTYTTGQWGIEQTHRYTNALTAAFQELAETPKAAAACKHFRPGYRRRCVERHVIYFHTTQVMASP